MDRISIGRMRLSQAGGAVRYRSRMSGPCSGSNKSSLAGAFVMERRSGKSSQKDVPRERGLSAVKPCEVAGVQILCVDRSITGVEHEDHCGKQKRVLAESCFGMQGGGDRPC